MEETLSRFEKALKGDTMYGKLSLLCKLAHQGGDISKFDRSTILEILQTPVIWGPDLEYLCTPSLEFEKHDKVEEIIITGGLVELRDEEMLKDLGNMMKIISKPIKLTVGGGPWTPVRLDLPELPRLLINVISQNEFHTIWLTDVLISTPTIIEILKRTKSLRTFGILSRRRKDLAKIQEVARNLNIKVKTY